MLSVSILFSLLIVLKQNACGQFIGNLANGSPGCGRNTQNNFDSKAITNTGYNIGVPGNNIGVASNNAGFATNNLDHVGNNIGILRNNMGVDVSNTRLTNGNPGDALGFHPHASYCATNDAISPSEANNDIGISISGMPLSNFSPVGYGDISVIGEMPVGGSTSVVGNVPVIGYVTFEGNIPAGGTVSVASSCGCGCNS